MALVHCGKCGQKLSRQAPTCPHCGDRDPFAHLRRYQKTTAAETRWGRLWARWRPHTVIFAAGVVLILFAGLVEMGSPRPTRTQARAVPTSACEREFRRVADIDDMHDTVTDLDLAVQVCESVQQWQQMSRKYPAAVDPSIAVIFLTNRCNLGSVGGPLCAKLSGSGR